MTVETCLSACDSFAYAALEYGRYLSHLSPSTFDYLANFRDRECWCGDSLAPTATKASAESQCNMKCLGDATELCGGSNRLTLYTHNSAVKVQAKFAFAQQKASLISSASQTSTSSRSTSSSSSTSPLIESTAKSSSSHSSSTTSKTTSQTSSTTMKTSKSLSTTSKSSTHTTSTTSKTTLLPTPSQTIGSYSYLGCANQTSPLALAGMSKTDSKKMTTETCQKYCLDNNYGLAATQNGGTCYCGNGLQSYSAVGQKSCNVPCTGNNTEVCGGAKSLSVWNSTSATIPPTAVKAVGAYALQGCYSGSNIIKAASHTSATGLTVESCVGYCITKGYKVAGVQDGKTCYCDSKLATTAKKESLASCNVLCAGNRREFCGAYGKNLVYQYDMSSVTNGVPKAMNQPNEATTTANTTSSA